MPTSPPPPQPARSPVSAPAVLPRRAALGVLAAAGGALALAACSGSPSGAPPASTSSAPASSAPPAGPDPLLADIADTEQLLSVYDQVLRAHTPLAARLRPLRANHAAHLAALRTAAGVDAASGTPTAPPSSPPTAAAGPVPKTPALALSRLRALERTAAAARTRSAIRSSGGRAAMLASIAACCAGHQAVLA